MYFDNLETVNKWSMTPENCRLLYRIIKNLNYFSENQKEIISQSMIFYFRNQLPKMKFYMQIVDGEQFIYWREKNTIKREIRRKEEMLVCIFVWI